MAFLESVYESAFAYELTEKEIFHFQDRWKYRFNTKTLLSFDKSFRADIIIDNKVIIELKSII